MPPLTSTRRRPVYFNPEAKSWTAAEEKHTSDALNFHKQLPEYQPTPLIPLTDVAAEIGVKAVYVKNESNRFGLPAFKILGASWGTYRAVISKLGLPVDVKVDDVRKAASESGIKLFAATDGNHGRAVARMGAILGIPAEIHIPKHLHQATVEFIVSEGADIVRSTGIYDDAIASATEAARIEPNGILVQDFAFDEYLDIPKVSLNDASRKSGTDALAVDRRGLQDHARRGRPTPGAGRCGHLSRWRRLFCAGRRLALQAGRSKDCCRWRGA